MKREEWQEIVDFEGYAVSSFGRVWSFKSDKELKPRKHTGGYLTVCLMREKKRVNMYIHRLVAQHFVPSDTDCFEVDHIDRDKTNNFATNLRWVNRSKNSKNFCRKNRKGLATRHLTPAKKSTIETLYKEGFGSTYIGKRVGVPRQTVYSFLKRKGLK